MSRSPFADLTVPSAPSPPSRVADRDYDMPREVADALKDVMDEGELRDAFFSDSLAGALAATRSVDPVTRA